MLALPGGLFDSIICAAASRCSSNGDWLIFAVLEVRVASCAAKGTGVGEDCNATGLMSTPVAGSAAEVEVSATKDDDACRFASATADAATRGVKLGVVRGFAAVSLGFTSCLLPSSQPPEAMRTAARIKAKPVITALLRCHQA